MTKQSNLDHFNVIVLHPSEGIQREGPKFRIYPWDPLGNDVLAQEFMGIIAGWQDVRVVFYGLTW
jgi:hypothetical protein